VYGTQNNWGSGFCSSSGIKTRTQHFRNSVCLVIRQRLEIPLLPTCSKHFKFANLEYCDLNKQTNKQNKNHTQKAKKIKKEERKKQTNKQTKETALEPVLYNI
jgi:hypothetical protein